jgi:hypothetical protein
MISACRLNRTSVGTSATRYHCAKKALSSQAVIIYYLRKKKVDWVT